MRTRKQQSESSYAFGAWVIVAIVIVGALLDVAARIDEARRDKYLLNHKCRMVNYAGAPANHLYECDTGLIRERDI